MNFLVISKFCRRNVSQSSRNTRSSPGCRSLEKVFFGEFVLGVATGGSLTRRSEGHFLAFYNAYYDFYISIFAVDFLCFSRNVTNCRKTT